jgi:ribosomal subunit interface protein
MSNEFQVVFHNIDQSPALIEKVNSRIQKLQRFSNDIIGGRVVLDSPHNNHHKGKVFSVTLEIHTSGKEVIVRQGQHDKPAHEDIYVAVRDAFNAAERQLKATDKKHRKETLAVENFEVVPESDEDDGEEFLASDDEEQDLSAYTYDEQGESDSIATRAA